jgi:hypothetical protein
LQQSRAHGWFLITRRRAAGPLPSGRCLQPRRSLLTAIPGGSKGPSCRTLARSVSRGVAPDVLGRVKIVLTRELVLNVPEACVNRSTNYERPDRVLRRWCFGRLVWRRVVGGAASPSPSVGVAALVKTSAAPGEPGPTASSPFARRTLRTYRACSWRSTCPATCPWSPGPTTPCPVAATPGSGNGSDRIRPAHARRMPRPSHAPTLRLAGLFRQVPSGTVASTATTDHTIVKERGQRFSCLDDLLAVFRWLLKPPRSLLPQPTRRNKCDRMDHGRPATMYRTDYRQRQASPGCTCQSQSANPARDRREQLARPCHLRQLEDHVPDTGQKPWRRSG